MTRAEEVKVLMAAYSRQFHYLATMADEPEKPKTPLQIAEDRVSRFLNGAHCTEHNHEAATPVEKLVMLKMLRLELPHISTSPDFLDALIRRELKKWQS